MLILSQPRLASAIWASAHIVPPELPSQDVPFTAALIQTLLLRLEVDDDV